MKFAPAVLLANPAIRNAAQAEAEIAQSRAHIAAQAKQDNEARMRASYDKPRTARDVKGNPWDANRWNATDQALIANADPDRADRLRNEAGLEDIFSPTREDAQRIQSSGTFIADRTAASVAAVQAPKTHAPTEPVTLERALAAGPAALSDLLAAGIIIP